LLDLCGNVPAIVCQPLFLLMEQLNGLYDEFVGGRYEPRATSLAISASNSGLRRIIILVR